MWGCGQNAYFLILVLLLLAHYLWQVTDRLRGLSIHCRVVGSSCRFCIWLERARCRNPNPSACDRPAGIRAAPVLSSGNRKLSPSACERKILSPQLNSNIEQQTLGPKYNFLLQLIAAVRKSPGEGPGVRCSSPIISRALLLDWHIIVRLFYESCFLPPSCLASKCAHSQGSITSPSRP